MVLPDRQTVIETNRSLRNIKNELETLLEKGVITEGAFDQIHSLLPAEGSLAQTQRANTGLPTPVTTPSTTNPPPSYSQSTGNSSASSAPPPLPGRKQPPPAAPEKPVLCYATALYQYIAQDARDCNFEKGDRVAVYEKMNADWWLGLNTRTQQEGIFPKSYVEEEKAQNGWGGGEKAGAYQGAYPPPPGQVNPYNAHAPPMAMANQGYGGNGEDDKPSKTEENTKKFGKKLGNAAIFGAGATLGGKIVNSIF